MYANKDFWEETETVSMGENEVIFSGATDDILSNDIGDSVKDPYEIAAASPNIETIIGTEEGKGPSVKFRYDTSD